MQWRNVGRIWMIRLLFHRLLCVMIEIDQLQCVNCWVIIHCLLVSCKQINHPRFALMIWPPLQLATKQWIITQQFTAIADIYWASNGVTNGSRTLNTGALLVLSEQRSAVTSALIFVVYSPMYRHHRKWYSSWIKSWHPFVNEQPLPRGYIHV